MTNNHSRINLDCYHEEKIREEDLDVENYHNNNKNNIGHIYGDDDGDGDLNGMNLNCVMNLSFVMNLNCWMNLSEMS